MWKIEGIAASPGIAIGQISLMQEGPCHFCRVVDKEEVLKEKERLLAAQQAAEIELDDLQKRTAINVGEEQAEVFAAHDVFIIGNAAQCMQDQKPLPMVAPVAMQQAEIAAKNICGLIRGKELKKFVYNDVGNMATIGRNAAVVHMGKFKIHGFLAWAIWSFVHVLRLIDFRNRAVVFIKWIWDYLVYERIVRIITRQ